MDACQWSLEIQAIALAIAKSLSTEDLTRVALVFTQLGTTMATIAALRGLDEAACAASAASNSSAAAEAADIAAV